MENRSHRVPGPPGHSWTHRLLYALFGVLATLAGMAVGYLVAALLVPASSPVLAIGSTIIDHTPHEIKDAVIKKYGTNDKPLLLVSVFGVVIPLGAVAGLLALKRLVYGLAMVVVLVAVAAGAALTRPASDLEFVVPSVFTALVGVLVLVGLDRVARPVVDRSAYDAALAQDDAQSRAAAAPGAAGLDVPSGAPDTAVPATGSLGARQLPAGPRSATRRSVLVATAIAAAFTALAYGAGKLITTAKTKAENIVLPKPADPAPALPAGLDAKYPGITPLRISNADFYRVDTRLDVPVISSEDWTLTIDGDVDNEVSFRFDDILKMPMIERDITLTCVSNTVGGDYVGGARWLGVRLTDLLDMAGIKNTKADQLLATDYQGMTIGSPLELTIDGRDSMLAIGMNGEQLPREHGFPARIVIPGLYGFISATKWVERLTLTTYDKDKSYWTERDWATDAPIKIQTRIDTPNAASDVKAGQVIVGGVAWAQQNGGVKAVEVSIDGGAWEKATLGPDVNSDYWRQWYYPWQATDGVHRLRARVTDGDGDVQSSARTNPFPAGASGITESLITVG